MGAAGQPGGYLPAWPLMRDTPSSGTAKAEGIGRVCPLLVVGLVAADLAGAVDLLEQHHACQVMG